MPVLDLVSRDPRIGEVTLVEPDVYKRHNVERHLFPLSAIGQPKARLARQWLSERRPDLQVHVLECDLLDPAVQCDLEQAARQADIGVCAADNEPAKYHFDALMRRHAKPWTLGEVLSGGIGGFVHRFVASGPCYGCVASHLQRSVTLEKPKAADYSQPAAAVVETTVPASKASIHAIAALHALLTLRLLEPDSDRATSTGDGFTSLLLSLQSVPDVFAEPFRPYRFRIERSATCLICQENSQPAPASPEDLDVALDQALARLGHD
jgi:molybdopterin/thiamine biosynthesis adenylyltransferase